MDEPKYGVKDLDEAIKLMKLEKITNPPVTEQDKILYNKKYAKLLRLKKTNGMYRRGPYKPRVSHD